MGAGGQTVGGSTGSSAVVKSSGCGTPTTATTGNGQTINVNGTNRTYNLKLPDNYDSNHAYRLFVSYHPRDGVANDISDAGFYGLLWKAGGSAIFVAPDGLNKLWSNSNGDDVEFSRQLISQLESQLCIDKSRIFCEGFSMGGSMSYAMACAMGDTIRAVAVHSGGPMSGCVDHSKPVAYFMTHGTQDGVCSYPAYGVPQLQDFAKTDGCKDPDPNLSAADFASAMPKPTDPSGTPPACADFTGCREGYPVRACIFVGPHTGWPGNWLPDETWNFFSKL